MQINITSSSLRCLSPKWQIKSCVAHDIWKWETSYVTDENVKRQIHRVWHWSSQHYSPGNQEVLNWVRVGTSFHCFALLSFTSVMDFFFWFVCFYKTKAWPSTRRKEEKLKKRKEKRGKEKKKNRLANYQNVKHKVFTQPINSTPQQ